MRTRFSDQVTRCLLAGAALLVLVPVLGASSNGSQGNPEVMPPNSSFRGHTYAEWSERWWLWDFSLPVDQNPTTTNGAAPCTNGQTGNVWFLVGIVGAPVTIHCTVPLGTALFFPIVDVECSSLEPDPFHGDTPEERAACAKGFMDIVTILSAVIDGKVVQNPGAYRVQSGDFGFMVPDNNILGVPGPTSGNSSADGFYLLLHPLSAGTHTIEIISAVTVLNMTFPIDTTYILQVAK
jgi:hypothetical protein